LKIRTKLELRYRLRKNTFSYGLWLLCSVGALLWLRPAHARIKIHVRGTAEFEGAALAELPDESIELHGFLKDELGAPIGRAKVRVLSLSPSRAVLPLVANGNCGTGATASDSMVSPPNATDDLTLDTSTDGRFCVHVRGTSIPKDHSIRFEFAGSEDYAATHLELPLADLRSPLEVHLDAPSNTIALDDVTTPVSFALVPSNGAPIVSPTTIALSLTLVEPTAPTTTNVIHRFSATLGTVTRENVKNERFGNPGPVELGLRFDGDNQFAPFSLKRRVVRTVAVSLEPRQVPNRVTAGEPFRIDCRVQSRRGPVTSGSVELTVNDVHQTLSRVTKDGTATVVFATNQTQSQLNLQLRYIPAQEGYTSAPPKTYSITIAPPSPWRFSGWIVAGLLVLGWFTWSRRRPPEVKEEPKPVVVPLPRAHIEVLGPPSNESIGWEGLVVDAHDGIPLGAARVALVVHGFEGSNVIYEVRSDESGTFRIPKSAVPQGIRCELIVEAKAYATFTTELPSPGQVKLYLVSIRRAILDRLVAWSKRRGLPFRSKSEPTPAWIAQVARQRGNSEVERWAHAVSVAAFGTEPPTDPQSPELLPPSGLDEPPSRAKSSES
jgi:hypothetical protein